MAPVPLLVALPGWAKTLFAQTKVRKLLSSCSTVRSAEKPRKRIKLEDLEDSSGIDKDADEVWLKFGSQFITRLDEELLIECDWLNDRHINFAQRLLRSQFPDVMGLGHTLLQAIPKEESKKIRCGVQVIHDRANHWIVASSMGCEIGTVKVYDSLYIHVNEQTKVVINNLFHLTAIKMLTCKSKKVRRIVDY